MEPTKGIIINCALCGEKKNFHQGYWDLIKVKGKNKLDWVCYKCQKIKEY